MSKLPVVVYVTVLVLAGLIGESLQDGLISGHQQEALLELNSHLVHGKIVADTVLPSRVTVTKALWVVDLEPSVNLLQLAFEVGRPGQASEEKLVVRNQYFAIRLLTLGASSRHVEVYC